MAEVGHSASAEGAEDIKRRYYLNSLNYIVLVIDVGRLPLQHYFVTVKLN